MSSQTMRNDIRDDWCGVRPEGVWSLLLERSKGRRCGRRCGCRSGGIISEKRVEESQNATIKAKVSENEIH